MSPLLSEERASTDQQNFPVPYELANGETADDAVRRIHQAVWPDIPVLVITATGLATDPSGRTKNGYRLLRKPLAPEALRAAMEAALATHPPTTVAVSA